MRDDLRAAAALQAAWGDFSRGGIAAARDACQQILRDSAEEAGALHLLGVIAMSAGDRLEGEKLLRSAMQAPGAKALQLLTYAELCRKASDPADALAITRRALSLDAQSVLGWHFLGTQLLEAREYAESRSCLERALQLNPAFWQSRSRLALLFARLGDSDAALACFAPLLSEQADAGDILAHYAELLQDLGRCQQALEQIERAIHRSPESLDHRLRAADIEMQLERPGAALDRLRAAADAWPHDLKLTVYLANVLRQMDRCDEAVILCRNVLARGVESAELLRAYGLALQAAGESEEALVVYDRAARERPGPALTDKGVLLAQLGRMAEAVRTFDQALCRQPSMIEAWYNKADAKTYAPADPDIGEMERLLASGGSHRDRMLLHFALGKAYMDGGNADAAFSHWHAGNRRKRALITYDPEAAAARLAAMAASAPAPLGRPTSDAQRSDVPVFIVGMPRSGSSLLEQILASHPDVQSSGEQTGSHRLFEARHRGGGNGPRDQEIAETILARLRTRAPLATRVIDKDLRNFMYLGSIYEILPESRIIHCRRDPLDTCFSAYTKLFAGDFPFTYDLRESGRYYRSYATLMSHWRAALPRRRFMELDYEELVDAPEATTRQLLDFLGLPWSEDCLGFFRATRAVGTASFAQVRQPIYRSSVGRSAAVITHLRELIDALHGVA